jgi:hypothetical protein
MYACKRDNYERKSKSKENIFFLFYKRHASSALSFFEAIP